MAESYVVAADLKGDLAAIDQLQHLDGQPVFLGNFIGGDEPEELGFKKIEAAVAAGGIAILGAIEFKRLQVINALNAPPELRSQADKLIGTWLRNGRAGRSVIEKYGINTHACSPTDMIRQLKDNMIDNGLYDFLKGLPLYFKSPDQDFLAIHGGLTRQAWWGQKKLLNTLSKQLQADEFCYLPEQVSSLKLARQESAFSVTDRTVITNTTILPANHRPITAEGRRVRLGRYHHKSIAAALVYYTAGQGVDRLNLGDC